MRTKREQRIYKGEERREKRQDNKETIRYKREEKRGNQKGQGREKTR